MNPRAGNKENENQNRRRIKNEALMRRTPTTKKKEKQNKGGKLQKQSATSTSLLPLPSSFPSTPSRIPLTTTNNTNNTNSTNNTNNTNNGVQSYVQSRFPEAKREKEKEILALMSKMPTKSKERDAAMSRVKEAFQGLIGARDLFIGEMTELEKRLSSRGDKAEENAKKLEEDCRKIEHEKDKWKVATKLLQQKALEWEEKYKQADEALKRAREEMFMLEKKHDEQMKEASARNQQELSRQIEALQNTFKEKVAKLSEVTEQLKQQRQDDAVEISALKVEAVRAKEKEMQAEKERDNYAQQIEEYKATAERKNSEFSAALASFSKTQAFNEDRTKQLSQEKEKLEEKIAQLQQEKNSLALTIDKLKSQNNETEKRLTEAERKIQEVRSECDTVRSEMDELRRENTELKIGLNKESQNAVSLQAQLTTAQKQWDQQKADLTEENQKLAYTHKLEYTEWLMKRNEAEKEAATLRERSKQLEKIQRSLETENKDLKTRLTEVSLELASVKKITGVATDKQNDNLLQLSLETEKLKYELAEKQRSADLRVNNWELECKKKDELIAQLRKQLFQEETARRKLHNTIQEIRGNIRVFARVRPFLGDEKQDEEHTPIECNPEGTRVTLIDEKDGKKSTPHTFEFDHVFTPKNNQEDIFAEISCLVQSALDGYKVCLLSYGQTGSGKTYTMQGLNGKHQIEERGIIPRAIEKVMETAARLHDQGWEYLMEVSFLEIYNETIRDLLSSQAPPNENDEDNGKGKEKEGLSIKLENGIPSVPGATRIVVKGPHQIDALMAKASQERSVAATSMNARSSRSHAVFTLYLTGTNQREGIKLQGSLSLCDLAGSERLARSQATGQRLKEAQAINKSLSCLADVFNALANKNGHIPYRNSKLTYLLQPCFSNHGKTVMLVNLSPTLLSRQESLCSLRFASLVSQIELGKAKKQISKVPQALPSSSSSSSSSSSAPAGVGTTPKDEPKLRGSLTQTEDGRLSDAQTRKRERGERDSSSDQATNDKRNKGKRIKKGK